MTPLRASASLSNVTRSVSSSVSGSAVAAAKNASSASIAGASTATAYLFGTHVPMFVSFAPSAGVTPWSPGETRPDGASEALASTPGAASAAGPASTGAVVASENEPPG